MSGVCRVCMADDYKNGTSIYDFDDTLLHTVSELIMIICNVSISKTDCLPDEICSGCLTELQNVFTFKSKCENSDQILRANFEKLKHTVVSSQDTVKLEDVEVKFEGRLDCDYSVVLDELPENDDQFYETKLEFESEKKPQYLRYKCEECNESFKRKTERTRHMKLHFYVCNGCKRKQKTKAALIRHIEGNKDCQFLRQEHTIVVEGIGKERLFFCTICNYQSKHISYLRQHIVVHNGAKPYKCNMCSNAYTQLTNLSHHKQVVHPTEDDTAICDICSKTYATRRRLKEHILKCHSNKRYSCNVCKAQLKTRQGLRIHMGRHSGKNFTCELCAASFYSLSSLIIHKGKHTGRERRFACPQCDYRATKKQILLTHLKRHSNIDKPFSCSTCGVMFETEKKVKIHKLFAHNTDMKKKPGKETYNCLLCDRVYKSADSAKRHMKHNHKIKECNLDKVNLSPKTKENLVDEVQ